MKKLNSVVLIVVAFFLGGIFVQVLRVDAQTDKVTEQNGDVNADGNRDISDAVYLLSWLFLGGDEPKPCIAQEPGPTPEQMEILNHFSLVELPDGQGGFRKTIRITGVNLQIVNGSDDTGIVNGLGNLIVGYQEPRSVVNPQVSDVRTGSHNVVVGWANDYTSTASLVVGRFNTIAGTYSVAVGSDNTASGTGALVSGGANNRAVGAYSSVSGGAYNSATGEYSSITGGALNAASGAAASIGGGRSNQATDSHSTVAGGKSSTVSQDFRTAVSVLEITGEQ